MFRKIPKLVMYISMIAGRSDLTKFICYFLLSYNLEIIDAASNQKLGYTAENQGHRNS